MEALDLISSAYWESESVDIRLNPKRPVDAVGLPEFLERECAIQSSVVIATSGSSGAAKFVVLRKSALLASARAVNEHCGLTREDRWLGGLSTFHVGGIGIYARAHCSGAAVVPMAWDTWTRDGSILIEAIERSRATLTSLTPVHLGDLVRAGARCPAPLRGVFLGGGRIDKDLVEKARELGWPLWATYGMSESSSQIATSRDGNVDWLPLLPIWECQTGDDGRLSVRGEALFSGYAVKEDGRWNFDPARDRAGWFTTGDRVEMSKGELRFLGRGDDLVKVSGELISLSSINARLEKLGMTGAIVALPDPRIENELILVVERGGKDPVERFNDGLPAVERVSRSVVVELLPRTDLGKLDLRKITELAASGHLSHPTG